MSTEYRRGIPGTAHVEAATRLGLLWQQADAEWREWRFEVRGRDIWCDFAPWDPRGLACLTEDNRVISLAQAMGASWRPIRPDGTPVDWEVLDQEVARVGQQGQTQGFRADLWQRIAPFYIGTGRTSLAGLEAPAGFGDQEIAARWTVYQELKPLYDLVDGAQGEAAMPRDVEAEWFTAATMPVPASGHWFLCRDARGIHTRNHRYVTWRPEEVGYGVPLRNFAAVLDAVAERRVAERMRGQTQTTTVTSVATQPEPVLDEAALRSLILNLPNVASITSRIERGSRQRDRYIVRVRLADPNVPLDRALAAQIPRNVHVHCGGRGDGFGGTAAVIFSPAGNREDAVAPPIQEPRRVNVEPRRFADVRPDRHGWRWWRQTGRDSTDLGQRFETQNGRCRWRSAHADAWFVPDTANPQMLRYTVIPTDEQGNPVSWESIEQERSAGQTAPTVTGRTATLIYVDDITTQAPSAQELRTAWDSINKTLPLPIQPPLLPRFTADELDDVDHSKTTKLDEVTLRRGKLPTVEQIAKYREVRAKRTGGSVADALKESRIDCEVAQYVLERWAGGLDNTAAHKLIAWVVETTDVGLGLFVCSAEARAQQWIDHHSPTLDTSEKPGPAVQRKRQEAEERRQRLAELRQRLAAERAAQPQEMAKESDAASYFDLIEPDPQADPAASIRAWEARQAAAKVRPVAVPPRIAKPTVAPRRPVIEVVDAEVDGLSRSEAFAALFGWALNGGC